MPKSQPAPKENTVTQDQETRQALDAKVAAFMAALPYAKALSMDVTEIGDGKAVTAMPYDTRLVGDPDTGVIHGGAVSALLDTCAGAAVMSHPSVTTAAATLDLRIDYMRPANAGQTIVASAECYHVTRSVAFVRATAVDDDADRPVATATATFTLAHGDL